MAISLSFYQPLTTTTLDNIREGRNHPKNVLVLRGLSVWDKNFLATWEFKVLFRSGNGWKRLLIAHFTLIAQIHKNCKMPIRASSKCFCEHIMEVRLHWRCGIFATKAFSLVFVAPIKLSDRKAMPHNTNW